MNTRHWPQVARRSPRAKPSKCGQSDVCDFLVIGELKDNPHQLLLMGDDGLCYAYNLATGDIATLDPDDSWSVDTSLPTSPRTAVVTHRIAS
jgi:hypothetical protein